MMSEYGQFCPVAKAAEVLGERWTLLVLRELLLGTTRFSALQRALPRASPSILVKRLRQLEQVGVVTREADNSGARHGYRLTRAGRDIGGVIEQMGHWAARWVPSRLGRDELDAYYLMLDISRRLVIGELPRRPASIGVTLDVAAREPEWWLLVRRDKADLCDQDPGFGLDVLIAADLRDLTAVWLGQESLAAVRRGGRLVVCGDRAFERSLPRWLGSSAFTQGRPRR